MKKIQHTSTLFHYDGPQVFEARDTIGGHHIAVMVDSDGPDDRFLVAGVAPERLREFRSGILDLRTLLIDSDDEGQYLATVVDGLNSNSHYGNGMATVNHFMLSQLSKLARLEAEMSRNIDFYALLAPAMAGITFVAFDQQP